MLNADPVYKELVSNLQNDLHLSSEGLNFFFFHAKFWEQWLALGEFTLEYENSHNMMYIVYKWIDANEQHLYAIYSRTIITMFWRKSFNIKGITVKI